MKKAVGYEGESNDGIFFMSENELAIGFTYISVGVIRKGYVPSCLPLYKTPNRDDIYFTFNITKPGPCNIKVCQEFVRFSNQPGYAYSPFIFEVIDMDNNKVVA